MPAPVDVDVVIVGAGLAGLTAATGLRRAGLTVNVVEARPRIGGRTLTVAPEEVGAAFDLGATWIWTDQPAVRALAQQLGLATFAQHAHGRHLGEEAADLAPAPVDVAPPPAPALRLVGGTQPLCDLLAAGLPTGSVILDSTVVGIVDHGHRLTVTTDAHGDRSELTTKAAVVAVPPRLALEKIAFAPALPDDVVRVMKLTPTWMGNAIKCVAVYESPFWRAAGLSGTAFSTVGPLREVHDASLADTGVGALWGLFSGEDRYREMGPGERAELAFTQLERLFGAAAGDPIQYFERDWSSDPNTNDEIFWVDETLLDYGHPLFARPQLNGRLIWAGAETIADGGGHLEGAVRSGHRAVTSALAAVAPAPGH